MGKKIRSHQRRVGRNNKVVQGQTFKHLYHLSRLLFACPTRSPEASCFDLGIIILWSLCQPGPPSDAQMIYKVQPWSSHQLMLNIWQNILLLSRSLWSHWGCLLLKYKADLSCNWLSDECILLLYFSEIFYNKKSK